MRLFFVCLGLALAGSSGVPSPSQLIRDVRVFDGERVLEHRSVLVANGVIAKLGDASLSAPGADVVEGGGRTLLPGLIDAHVHMADQVEEAARQALAFGVTTQLDMWNAGARLRRIKALEAADPPDAADVRTAGTGATAPGGHPTQMGGPPFPTVSRPDEAQAFVDARIAEGSDYIKIIYDDARTWTWRTTRVPTLDVATLRALVAAAHRRGKLAIVHVLAEEQAREAIEAGADGLAHLFAGESAGPGFGDLAASRRVFVVPTLSVADMACGKPQAPALLADARLGPRIEEQWRKTMEMAKPDPDKTRFCRATEDALRQLVRAHVPVLAGTDAPIPGVTYGASLHGELELLVAGGLTPLQALAAATAAPARAFRLADRGLVREGLRADLLLVEGDPTRDILATRNVVAVWKRGVRAPR